MLLAPLADALAMSGSAEVVFIPRPAQPPALTLRLRGPAAVGCRTIALAPRTAGFAIVYLIAMEALERWFWFHRRARTQAPRPPAAPAERTKKPPPIPRKKTGKDRRKRRKKSAAWKLSKKTPPLALHPIFKPPALSGFHFATRRFIQDDYRERILPFDEAAAWEWARYIRLAKDAGFSPPLLDSQIAATALAWGLTVVPRNESDFPLMEVVNPFTA